MARGRKKIQVPTGEILSDTPPKDIPLTPRGKKIWKDLAAKLREMGHARDADTRIVAVAATAIELLENLNAALAESGSLLVEGSPHPLLAEIRRQRGQVQSLLTALMLTPRARSSSRLPKSDLVAVKNKDKEKDDDVIMKLLEVS
jgi:phage terminase small subunit